MKNEENNTEENILCLGPRAKINIQKGLIENDSKRLGHPSLIVSTGTVWMMRITLQRQDISQLDIRNYGPVKINLP